MEQKKKYKVIVVESSPIVTAGLKALFEFHPEFEIIQCYPDISRYQERSASLHPDLLLINPALMDYSKRMNVKSLLLHQEIPIFALAYTYIESDVLKQYNGSIEINDDMPGMVRKLKQVMESNSGNAEIAENYELSERELEILTAVAKGMTNKEIADLHTISVHTVISHRKNITRKTGIKTVSGLTVYALLNNLIDQTDME